MSIHEAINMRSSPETRIKPTGNNQNYRQGLSNSLDYKSVGAQASSVEGVEKWDSVSESESG